MKILKSASKIVFMALAFTACVGFSIGKLESADFMVLASMAFGFYFSYKGDNTKEYAGK
jgi:hypothetical protein